MQKIVMFYNNLHKNIKVSFYFSNKVAHYNMCLS